MIAATDREAANRLAMLCDFLVSSSSLSDEEDDEDPQQLSSRLDCDALFFESEYYMLLWLYTEHMKS